MKFLAKEQRNLIANLSAYQQLLFWDIFISGLVHSYQNLTVTVLLMPPSLMFNPQLITLPVIFIWYLYGIEHALKYVTVIVAALMLSTYLKRRIKRQRPKMRDDMMLKPMIIRKRENNHSMPSGDSIQAGVFLYAYLHRFDEAIDNHLSRFIVCLLMINVLLGRVYFCCHYFSDTVVGFIIGVIVSFMAFNYLYV